MRFRATIVSLVIVAALVVNPAADATFPGPVGKITFYAGAGEIATVDPDGSNLSIISNAQLVGFDPAWSPDGNMLAVASTQEEFSAIWVMNPNGTSPRRLTTKMPGESVSDIEPAWSPDGSKIVFGRTVGSAYELFVVNVDGTGLANLTNTLTPLFVMDEETPAWSPDGSKIVFVAEGDIWVMNSDGSGATNLTDTPGPRDDWPSWSPDGSRIIWSLLGDDGGIWTMAPDGSAKTEIRPNCTSCELWDVAWSPDGAQIAFIQDDLGDGSLQERLWVMNADGTGEVPIVDDVGQSFDWGVPCTQNCTLPPECEANPSAICGSEGDDVIEGTAEDDVIFGGDGDDVIIAGGGNDTIIGGAGIDNITGGGGKDLIVGDSQNTNVAVQRALMRRGVRLGPSQAIGFDDLLFGGGGNDKIFGGGGIDTIKGSAGKDNTDGEEGNDNMFGGGGDDTLKGGLGSDKMNGQVGLDHCFKGQGDTVKSCEQITKRHR